MTKVDVDVDELDQIYINVFTTKPRLNVFANICTENEEHVPTPINQTSAEILSSDSPGSDSDKLFEDFGDIAMNQTPLMSKKNKSQKKKIVVKNSEELPIKVAVRKEFFT